MSANLRIDNAAQPCVNGMNVMIMYWCVLQFRYFALPIPRPVS